MKFFTQLYRYNLTSIVKILVYIFSAVCAAIVGLITASQLEAAHPATGETWEMNAIAAAVLGGTSMAGGIGTIGGTIVGAFVIGVISDGMVMCGVSEFWQMIIKGLVIILAVIIDQFQRNMEAKMALQQGNQDLAKKALTNKVNADKQAEQYQSMYDQATTQVDALKNQVDALKQKLDEARSRQSMLIARSKMADAQQSMAKSLGNMDSSSAFAKLDKMEEKIESKEARADAFAAIRKL